MRQLYSLDGETQAQQFAAYLFTLGIDTTINVEMADPGDGNKAGIPRDFQPEHRQADLPLQGKAAPDPVTSRWVVWIHEEDDLEQARLELDHFLKNPGDPRYTEAVRQAGQRRKEEAEQRDQIHKQQVNMQSTWGRRLASGGRPLTITLLLICVVVFLFSGFGDNMEGTTMRALQFVDLPAANKRTIKRIAIADKAQQLSTRTKKFVTWTELLAQDKPGDLREQNIGQVLSDMANMEAFREEQSSSKEFIDKHTQTLDEGGIDEVVIILQGKLVAETAVLSRQIAEVNKQAKAINLLDPANPATLSGELRELDKIRHGQPTDRFYDHKKGQVWRVVTPIFIHLGLMHLVFNMIWLYQLGGVLESRYKSIGFGALVLFTGVAGVLAQCCMPYEMPFAPLNGGVLGGGMSGVVFGLLGFTWVKTRLDPASGLGLRGNIFGFMMIWLVLGFSGILDSLVGGSIANWAHGGGLVAGMLVAYLSIRRR